MKILILLLVISWNLSGQSNVLLKSHGNYIMSVTCKAGIVVGSDSRNVWSDNNKKIVAYTDVAKKIFDYNNLLIAMAGQHAFAQSNITFYGLFEKFKKANKENISIDVFYDTLLNFCKPLLTLNEFIELSNNQFIISGYLEGKRKIYLYSNQKIEEVTDFGFKTNFAINNSGDINSQFVNIFRNSDLWRTDFAIKGYLDEIILLNNEDSLGVVGGKPAIVNIDNNGKITWVEGNQNDTYSTVKDYLIAVLNNKIKIHYVSKADEVILKKAFKYYTAHH